jgi:cytochrome c-type biogenesis protein CcmF
LISQLGHALILGALASAVFGGLVGLIGGISRREALYVWPRRAVYVFFACMLAANLSMVFALVTHDFSVKYVAHVGSRTTPMIFTVVSLWSALEGSILFWGVILGTYLLAFSLFNLKENPRAMSLATGTMLLVGVFFAFLIIGPADPFTPVSPVPADGPGPNALLQNHILMVIHPPMLYLGYVGMVVPFGIAISALIRGELGEAWSVPLRRWTMIPWTFLSVGIILGSWWAYAVLGWGGYWAWDPVENASFLPWLTATAFLHSLMVVERKKTLRLWTLSLSLASFVLTIVGTFMTRSGIFNSVHSFTQSDIGPTFLVFICIVLVVSISLLTARGHLLLAEPGSPQFPPVSRETSILVNNLVFTGITFTVLVGTTFPLINEAIRGTRLSVGEPYFNIMAVPMGIAVLFLMGVGPSLPWGETDNETINRNLVPPLIAGAVVTGLCLLAGARNVPALITYGLAGFSGLVTLRELFMPGYMRMREHKEAPWEALFTSASRARRRFGGYIVHAGIITILVAVAASHAHVQHIAGTLSAGRSLALGRYQVTYEGIERGAEPHREWRAARVHLTDSGGLDRIIRPRMNFYERQTEPVPTPAVVTRAGEDFYLSLTAFTEEGQTASFNAWIFPLVAWIWWSIPTLAIGSLIAMWPQRRRAAAVALAGSTPPEASGSVPGAA